MTQEPISVRVRDCACPDAPHAAEGDLIYLRPTLSLEGGILAEQQLYEAAGDPARLTRLWLHTFVRHGAMGWNLLDEDGDPVPFDVDTILNDWTLARPVGDAASDTYSDAVMRPFQKKLEARSPTGRTRRGTSRTHQPTPESSA